jgi:hypothetical protein
MAVMVTMLDPDGLPRAWATAPNEAAARAEAQRQIDTYKEKKRVLGDPLGWAWYTPKVETLP